MLTRELIEYGLTEKEAKTYLAILELEVAPVQEIARTAGINRSTAYVTLEALQRRGLVSISDEKNTRQYIATPPEAILRSAEDMALQQENVRRKIEAIIPDMKALYKGTKTKPIIKVYEGKEGLIAAFEDTLSSKEKLMRVVSSVGTLGETLPEYLREYVNKRFALNIKMHGIHPNDEAHRMLVENSPKNFDISIAIPKEKYAFKADIAIYDNKIGYMAPKGEGVAVIIESKEISDVMKSVFDLAFEEAKRLNTQIYLKRENIKNKK